MDGFRWVSFELSPAVAIAGAYLPMSLVTLVVYRVDKSAARIGRARVPESMLHLLAVLGGWPGALVGMQWIRHKRRKTGFVITTLLIAIAHVAAWIWWYGRPWQ